MYMPAEGLIVLFLYFVIVEVSVVRFFRRRNYCIDWQLRGWSGRRVGSKT